MAAAAEWDRLARDVAATLTRAGLTARVSERISEEMPTGGATITIEALGDAGDGVYVSWNHHPSLDAVVRRAVESLDLSVPELPFAAAALEAMRIALQAILRAASFNVSDAYDESGAQAVVRLPPG